MQCPKCGGGFEFAGGGQHARCMRCLSLYQMGPQGPTPVQVEAPGGGHNQEFENIMAQNLGFGPPPPGAGRHNIPDARIGDVNLKVRINGMSPENYAKNKASQMIWGWIIGGVILVLMVLIGGGVGLYVWLQAKKMDSPTSNTSKTADAMSWDGKSTFSCSGNDSVKLKGVTANVSDVGVSVTGNCQLTLENVNITAPVGISAMGNAKVTMIGGSINASKNAIDAMGNCNFSFSGTTVKGKLQKMGNVKVSGI